MDALGKGVYSFSEAAKLVNLNPKRIREWFRGGRPVFVSDLPPLGSEFAISFLDLVEVFVAGHLRDFGISLRAVRQVHFRLSTYFKNPHPFARQELLTDGQDVFVRGIDKDGESEIYEAITRQKVFPTLILPFLKQIDYARMTNLADRWRIADGVVVDPRLCFGQPVLARSAIPTRIVAAEYLANDRNEKLVGDWYRITSKEVLQAVKFEYPLGVAA